MDGRALQSADETANLALQAITARSILPEGSPVVVESPWAQASGAVVLELMWSPEEMTLTNDAGEEILYQPIHIGGDPKAGREPSLLLPRTGNGICILATSSAATSEVG